MQTLQNASITHGIDEEYIEITGLQQKANKIDTHKDPLGEFQTFTAQTEDQLNQCKRDIQLTGFDGDSSKNILTTGKQTYGSDCLTQLFKTQNLNEQIFSNPMIKSDYFFYTTTVLSINATAINKVLIAKVRKGTWILEEKSFPDRLIMSDSQKTIDEVQLYRRSETQNAVLITLINTLDDTSEGVIFFFDDNFANVKSYKYSYFGGDGASFRILGMALFDTEPVSTLLYKHKISTTDYLSLYQTVSDKQELTRFLRVTLQSPFTAASNNADIKHAQDTTATNGRFYFAYLAAQNNQLNIFLGQQGSNMESDLQISSSYSTSVELETVQIMELSTDNIYFGGPSKANPTWKYMVLHATVYSNGFTFNKLLTITSQTLAESLITPKFFMASPSTAILYSALSTEKHLSPYSHLNIIIYKSIDEVLQLPETNILLTNVLTTQTATYVTDKIYNIVEQFEIDSSELTESQDSTFFSQDGFVYLNGTNQTFKNYQKGLRFMTENNAPTANLSTVETPVTVKNYESKTWKVELISDTEGDTASFEVVLQNEDGVAINPLPTWWSVDSTTDTFAQFSVTTPNYQQPGQSENFKIKVSLSDSFNTESPNVYTIALTVTSENRAPTKKTTVNLNLGTFTVMSGDSYSLVNTRDFEDLDEHEISIACTYKQSTTDEADYIQAVKEVDGTVQTVTFKENPSYVKPTDYSQNLAGDYSFDCDITDDFSGTNTYTFEVTVAENTEVVAVTSKITATIDNQTATVQSATVSFDTKCTSDEEDVLYDLKYDGTSVTDAGNTLNGKVTFDTSTMLITYFNSIEPISSDGGSTYDPYVLTLECTDPFHPTAQTVTVEITVVDSDKHPIIVNAQADVEVLYSLTSTYVIVDRDDFSDNTTILSYAIVGAGFKSGPDNTDFEVSLDASYTGEGVKFLISGLSFERDDAYGATVNKIQAYVAVTDDANPEQTIYSEFFIVPIQCHAECYTCTGLANNECSSCDQLGTNYLTDLNTCGACENNQYDDTNWVCQDCDDLCTTCASFGTDIVTNECQCAQKIHGTACLDECPASTHDRNNICEDNVDPTITNPNEATDQTKSVRKDATHSWTITAGDDDEEDTVTLAIKSVTKKMPIQEDIAVNTVNDKWIYITGPAASTDDFTVEFKDYKDNGEVIALGETIFYDVELEATDSLGGTATYTIHLTVEYFSSAPYILPAVSRTIPALTIESTLSFDVLIAQFIDDENDPLTLTCIQKTPVGAIDNNWITLTSISTGVEVRGTTPADNSYAGTYVITCTIADEELSNSYDFTLTVNANQPIVITNIADVSIEGAQSIDIPLSDKCNDPELSTVTYSIKVNGDDYSSILHGAIFTWSASTQIISFNYQTKSQEGVYQIDLTCEDGITAAVSTSFVITAVANLPLVIERAVANQQIPFTATTFAISTNGLFSDPESMPFTINLTGKNKATLSPIFQSFSEGVLSLGATYSDAQLYDVAFIGIDNIGQEAEVDFTIEILGCYSNCESCDGILANQCTSCIANYLLLKKQCVTSCPEGTFTDTAQRKCIDCPVNCETCTSSTVCQTCKEDAYFYNDECMSACPSGFEEIPSTMTCQKIQVSAELKACQDFIASMPYLTDTELSSFDQMQSESVSCNLMDRCQDGTSGPKSCSWERKLSMKCGLTAKKFVSLRIASNSYPNHCVDSSAKFPDENLIDFEVRFNIKADLLTQSAIDTQVAYQAQVCQSSWVEDSNFGSLYEFTKYTGTTDKVVGISINGVPILQGLSESGYDPYYPRAYGSKRTPKVVGVDFCLGYTGLSKYYHYYTFSPCMLDTNIKAITDSSTCADTPSCKSSVETYITQGMSITMKTQMVVGIAKDGHKILGPFKTDGKLWRPCELDICNGITINGEYFYAMTLFFPYTIACWGPATASNTFTPTCSTNVQTCSAVEEASSFAILLQLSTVLIAVLMVVTQLI
eukprot:403367527